MQMMSTNNSEELPKQLVQEVPGKTQILERREAVFEEFGTVPKVNNNACPPLLSNSTFKVTK